MEIFTSQSQCTAMTPDKILLSVGEIHAGQAGQQQCAH